MTERFINPMEDFKPVFQAIREKIRLYSIFATAIRENRKLPEYGGTREEREAIRAQICNDIHVKNKPGFQASLWPFGISALLTAHRHLRGKAANHGISAALAETITTRIVDNVRKELAEKAAAVA